MSRLGDRKLVERAQEALAPLLEGLPQDLPAHVLLSVSGDTRLQDEFTRTRERLFEVVTLAEEREFREFVIELVAVLRALEDEIARQHARDVLVRGAQDWGGYRALLEELRKGRDGLREISLASGSPALGKEDIALAFLFKHPQWSVAQIAKKLGVNARTPYKWRRFRKAWRSARRARGAPPRGFKTSAGDVESISD